MKKIEGLKFLQEKFPTLTVDCTFVDKVEDLDEKALMEKGFLWRVRGGKSAGSELNLPQGTFTKIRELKKFMKEQQKKDSNIRFVIHTVTPDYFEVPFVGTLAVYNNKLKPSIRIELQKVTKQLVQNIDKGKRPRDWDTCLILDYDLLYKFPKIVKRDEDINLEELKYTINTLYRAGEKIFEYYDEKGNEIDSYTRFNVYSSGNILFDDHRSAESFIPKFKASLKSRTGYAKNKIEEYER